jgi:hypothetical protein
MIRRKIAIVLLTLGSIGGYAAGFASLRAHGGGCNWREQRQQAFEQHVARVCVDAARQADGERGGTK